MDWKDLLKKLLTAAISVIIPVLYTWFVNLYPDFPLSLEQVLAVALWIVSLLFAGWKLATIHHAFFSHHFSYRKHESINRKIWR